MAKQFYDFIVIGAGIIGLTTAFELKKRFKDSSIAILEKESELGKHASGRNSGVLHAGFYYTKDSLKAKFTSEGNGLMQEFCKQHHLTLNTCGKLVVAKNKEEVEVIKELYQRGLNNGVQVKIITEKEAKEMETNVKTTEVALYSPNTASVSPIEILNKLAELLKKDGVDLLFNTTFLKGNKKEIFVKKEGKKRSFGYKHFINCAGLYADKIAHQFGAGLDYTIIPFKGAYLKYNGSKGIIHRHIYPVPNLKNPFLGVHFTKTFDDEVKIGPTSMPAFWRENYKGFQNFKLKEFIVITFKLLELFIRNSFGFRSLAIDELKKYKKTYMIDESKKLLGNVEEHFSYRPAGIRAQLLNKKNNQLVMDFKVEFKGNSLHILNAVSPAFTSSFSFAKYIVDELVKHGTM